MFSVEHPHCVKHALTTSHLLAEGLIQSMHCLDQKEDKPGWKDSTGNHTIVSFKDPPHLLEAGPSASST